MSSPFVAEIRIFPFNFAPRGWAFCNGQILPLSQNTALFSLLGTQYGGDGKSNFALPNLQGNVAIHTDQYSSGGQFPIGADGGEQYVTLLTTEMPSHSHSVLGDNFASSLSEPGPANALARAKPGEAYSDQTSNPQTMAAPTIGVAGGGQPHNNLMPYLTLSYSIALQGIYPARP